MRPTSLLLVLALLGGATSRTDETATMDRPPQVPIPPRRSDAITGSGFAAATAGLTGRERQRRARAELEAGNVPAFLHGFRSVRIEHLADGVVIDVVLWVAPDYLALGSESDFLRIPLDYPTATAVAGRFGCVLPTPRIVDAVYEQADFQFAPQPMRPGPRMRSSAYYLRHQQLVESERKGQPRGALVAGHKKDVVITNRLLRNSRRVAIYGWHRGPGDPIQPLSTVHGAHYADYSHGVRLVWRTIWIDGRPIDFAEALRDPALAPALTYEGTIRHVPRLMRPAVDVPPEPAGP